MELCPKCKRMTAETNHYTKELVCYNRYCEGDSNREVSEMEMRRIKCPYCNTILLVPEGTSDDEIFKEHFSEEFYTKVECFVPEYITETRERNPCYGKGFQKDLWR